MSLNVLRFLDSTLSISYIKENRVLFIKDVCNILGACSLLSHFVTNIQHYNTFVDIRKILAT